jgi:hypothetical protein
VLSYRGDTEGITVFFDAFIQYLQRSRSLRSQWQVFGVA